MKTKLKIAIVIAVLGITITAVHILAAPAKNEDTARRCSNNKDDDKDGLIDCADPDCASFCGGPVDPSVEITNPSNGANVSGTILITATASHSTGIEKVEFSVDSTIKCTDTSNPYSCSWDTTLETNGGHLLKARAFSNESTNTNDTINVNVNNGGANNLSYSIYFMDGTNSLEDSALGVINGASNELRLAMYGFNSNSIRDALINRHNGGVTVLVATEKEQRDNPNYSAYYDALADAGITVIDDNDVYGESGSGSMHNKFIVADGEKVWTGSTNFTTTGFSDNRNHVIVLNHFNIAEEYVILHQNFMNGEFHKSNGFSLKTFNFDDAVVKLSFSPYKSGGISITETLHIDTINNASNSIKFLIFYWNRTQITDAVLGRKSAGVFVEGVFDAVGSAYGTSQDNTLCNNGVSVEIEDFGGKVHHKLMLIDDSTVLLGSANFTSSGYNYNDENMLVITHAGLASAVLAQYNSVRAEVDNRLNCCEHSAETPPISTGSLIGNACTDGRDNDYDGYIDGSDSDCSIDLVAFCEGGGGTQACESGPENTSASCSDGFDNDGDGYLDCVDFDCCPSTECPSGCGTGKQVYPNQCSGGGGASPRDVVINEIAWMGSTNSAYDEWIELYNNTNNPINLSGWTLRDTDGTPNIALTGTIPANGYYLLERTDDNSVPEITANQIYTGGMNNSNDNLKLMDGSGAEIDFVDTWYAGNASTRKTMERIISANIGTDEDNWANATSAYSSGYGTPKAYNSVSP